jgi:hypothetical protein
MLDVGNVTGIDVQLAAGTRQMNGSEVKLIDKRGWCNKSIIHHAGIFCLENSLKEP